MSRDRKHFTQKVAFWVATAVLAPLLIWAVTREGGLLNPKKDAKPVVREARAELLSSGVHSQLVGSEIGASFDVNNAGNAAARDCVILWYVMGNAGSSLPVGTAKIPLDVAVSQPFGLEPGERREIAVSGRRKWIRPGLAQGTVTLKCENSPQVERATRVLIA